MRCKGGKEDGERIKPRRREGGREGGTDGRTEGEWPGGSEGRLEEDVGRLMLGD